MADVAEQDLHHRHHHQQVRLKIRKFWPNKELQVVRRLRRQMHSLVGTCGMLLYRQLQTSHWSATLELLSNKLPTSDCYCHTVVVQDSCTSWTQYLIVLQSNVLPSLPLPPMPTPSAVVYQPAQELPAAPRAPLGTLVHLLQHAAPAELGLSVALVQHLHHHQQVRSQQ